jgi:hypothetical protein
MATFGGNRGSVATSKPPLSKTTPDRYVSLGDLLEYNKPDNRDLLIKTFGDQGITGFLKLTGAVRSAGVADEVQYWEEGRLHKSITATFPGVATADTSVNLTVVAGDVRANDVLLGESGLRLLVTEYLGSTTAAVRTLDGAVASSAQNNKKFSVIGNLYAQGTDQPTAFLQTDVTKRTNPFMIVKDTYHVNGSQATNIGWINVGNGDYRWYVKGEMDTRKRFLDMREMMMIYGQKSDGTSVGNNNIVGSEGYFAAIEDRGIVSSGTSFGNFDDIDAIILELDKEGAPSEYAMYVDRQTALNIDDMIAQGPAGTSTTAGLAGKFGAFQNNPDMAVQLGFQSFTRGGYTFHKHDWKLLNDPNLGGLNGYHKGALCPMSQVADAKTGVKSPALEMNFKETNGYSRELDHWVEGGGVLGYQTNGEDKAKFHYRSECNLVTRAANQHVLLR